MPQRSWASTPFDSSSGRSSSGPHRWTVRRAVRRTGSIRCPTYFNIINSMLFLCAVVLGGQGNKLGVIFGRSSSCTCRTGFSGVEVMGINLGELYLFFGLALVVLMIFRPKGCSQCGNSCSPTDNPRGSSFCRADETAAR